MSNLRDRQEGFEKKFAMDEELKFKAVARRNKLLGLWAAEKLGKAGQNATTIPRKWYGRTSRKPETTMSSGKFALISTRPAFPCLTARS